MGKELLTDDNREARREALVSDSFAYAAK